MTLPLPATNRNDRRQRIVLAASQMFAERAYVEVQMDELARAAAVAKPTIYRYFSSKEDLFLEALDGTMSELVAEVCRVADEKVPAPMVLQQMIGAALRSFARCTAAIRALDGSDAALGERGRAMLRRRGRQIREEFERVLQRGVAAREFRGLDPDLASRAILGAVRLTATAEDAPNDEQAALSLTDLLLNGISPQGSQG
ncbi:TetR/AcrR family transcriptional regulator [Dongia deserti]|uniref:TetR/AcrR family transcriptional regulator n=1 Tax=Dongia deserti TaxID=2268030 RepID=UPI000E65BEEB|nr:TetR/AcrR family transcriptional regulator [Dongia deserti]